MKTKGYDDYELYDEVKPVVKKLRNKREIRRKNAIRKARKYHFRNA